MPQLHRGQGCGGGKRRLGDRDLGQRNAPPSVIVFARREGHGGPSQAACRELRKSSGYQPCWWRWVPIVSSVKLLLAPFRLHPIANASSGNSRSTPHPFAGSRFLGEPAR